MGNKKKKKKKKTGKKEILILIVLSALLSSAGLYSYFSEDLEETANVSGTFIKYEEKKRRVNKTRRTYYAVYLDDNKYTIPRIYSSALNKQKFLSEVSKGDRITLAINDSKAIYQITKADTNYIDSNKLKEEVESNDFIGLIMGCFFLAGMGYLVYIYTKL
ncbi:hypothetical protein [uncultured Psychroserpens sp.]|uniref:hypothetical protein n=1 Tax=uncultured Psychroserpens sp. TaxID=255436 RepID=UPI00262FAF8A|nr:hypothetical protein [uncultured Psychroserpens sp.]